MVNDAGGAPLGEVPVVLFDQDTMEPGKGTPRFTSKGALGLGSLGAGQCPGGNAFRLVVDQEQGYQQGMDNVAVQAESILLGGGVGMTVGGAETRALGATLLAVQLVAHCSKGLIALQHQLVVIGDAERGSGVGHGEGELN